MQKNISEDKIQKIVEIALQEDLAGGVDLTSSATLSAVSQARAKIVVRKSGVLCGMACAVAAFAAIDKTIVFKAFKQDGAIVEQGDVLAEIKGPARSILTAERTALNFLTHLSGVATLTKKYVDAVVGTHAEIRDTRKTIPTLRALQKYAVRMGGGVNHRMGLYDAILIKDNHIAAAGGAALAINQARELSPPKTIIEIEVDHIKQIAEVLPAKPDIIMLDNFSLDDLRKAVLLIGGQAKTEASGGVTLASVRAIAETGVDIISVGALTHSAPALDIALDM